MRRALHALAVVVVLACGVWLRARHVAHHGLWLDEFGTVWASRGDSAAEACRRVLAIHGQSPLHYLIVRATTRLLGESETTVRLPSVVFGSLVPLLAYLGCAKAFGRRAGAAALLILALHPGLVDPAQTARPYPLAQAGLALAFLGLAHALASGSATARLVAWSGGVLAVYAHYAYGAVLPALFFAPLFVPRAARVYRPRALLVDAALAACALAPILPHVARVFGRRAELAWVPVLDLGQLGALAFAEERWVFSAAFVLIALRAGGGKSPRALLGLRRGGEGALAFAGTLALGTLGGLLALYATGINIVAERYLTPGIVGTQLLLAWAVGTLPRWPAIVALALLGGSMGRGQPANFGQEWREVALAVDSAEPRPGEPILLWPCFVEANLLVKPNAVDADRRAFMTAPMEIRLGAPDRGRHYVLLTSSWRIPGQHEYFERAVVPPLARARSFLLIAHPLYAVHFESWLAERFPDRRFRAVARSREFAGPTVVARYELAP